MASENENTEKKPLRTAALLSIRVAYYARSGEEGLNAEQVRELLNGALSDFEFAENMSKYGITMDDFEIASEGHDPAEFGLG